MDPHDAPSPGAGAGGSGTIDDAEVLRLLQLERLHAQLFSANPSTMPDVFHGLKDFLTPRFSSSWSTGSAAQDAQRRMFSGFALPAIVVAMSGFATLNCKRQFGDVGVPRRA
jgi:hypothetical protein